MKSSVNQVPAMAMNATEFRKAGHMLVDEIAALLEQLPQKPVTTGEEPAAIRALISKMKLQDEPMDAVQVLEDAKNLLFDHSLFNGHPRFWGYITSSAAPIGALGDLLAAAVNPNVGAFALSPMATEIERQTIGWIADLIGYNTDCGGIFVSGGNMANFVGFLAARKRMLGPALRQQGLSGAAGLKGDATKTSFTCYCAQGTHTWIQKATELFGHGTDSIRWVDVNEAGQMDTVALQRMLAEDRKAGHFPFLVVGTAGSVGTGVVDPLEEIAGICREQKLWFHVDGAYGAPAAMLPELKNIFKGLDEADSIALDPHKWLYSPLEAGCTLVKDPAHLQDAFSFHPDYYNFGGEGDDQPLNFHEYGPQNSRGFRALKVWLSLRQVGRQGIASMIRKNISDARYLQKLVEETSALEFVSHNLSITCFRFIPPAPPGTHTPGYLNAINEALLNRLQAGGEVFLSNATVNGQYCLRICIVNFRTETSDMDALVHIVLREGAKTVEEFERQLKE